MASVYAMRQKICDVSCYGGGAVADLAYDYMYLFTAFIMKFVQY